MKKKLTRAILVVVALFVGIQLVPYGFDHTNPPVTGEPEWASPEVRELSRAACFDCHSNETTWPWYSHVAPARWLVYRDVVEGREHLNFSELDRPQRDADEAAEVVREAEMPLPIYPPLHPEARLTDAQRQTLVDGYAAMFGTEGDEHGEHDD